MMESLDEVSIRISGTIYLQWRMNISKMASSSYYLLLFIYWDQIKTWRLPDEGSATAVTMAVAYTKHYYTKVMSYFFERPSGMGSIRSTVCA